MRTRQGTTGGNANGGAHRTSNGAHHASHRSTLGRTSTNEVEYFILDRFRFLVGIQIGINPTNEIDARFGQARSCPCSLKRLKRAGQK